MTNEAGDVVNCGQIAGIMRSWDQGWRVWEAFVIDFDTMPTASVAQVTLPEDLNAP